MHISSTYHLTLDLYVSFTFCADITARGLAKFGQLILQGGSNGNGTQILPKHWTDELKSKLFVSVPFDERGKVCTNNV